MKILLATPTLNRKSLLVMLAAWACATVAAQELQVRADGAVGKTMPDGIDTISDNFIFTNLNPTPLMQFSLTSPGRNVLGPSNSLGLPQQSAAIAFIPRVGSRAMTLKAAVQWISGTKRVKLAIYTDTQGVPGTPLPGGQGVTTVIPTYPSCCALAEVTLAGRGARVNAGKKYWLVASSDPLAPNFTGKWLDSSIASNADKTGMDPWIGTDLQWGAGEVDGMADNSCPSDCPGASTPCVCNGNNCVCSGSSSLEDLFSLACSSDRMVLYPDLRFTQDKINEIFSGLPGFSVREREDGAIEVVNSNHKR